MVKYGLRPCTLKGELFSLLSKAGSCGLKVSVLAKSSEVFLSLVLERNCWYWLQLIFSLYFYLSLSVTFP